MSYRITLERAYILHRRPYSNTSLLIDFLTEHYGRVAALARSARGLKSRYRGKLEPFTMMLISWSGKGELKTLGAVEWSDGLPELVGDALLSGFYLSEIVQRLVQYEDPCASLFALYHHTLQKLNDRASREAVLRQFEKQLLQELGFGLSFSTECVTFEPVVAQGYYRYIPQSGFKRVETGLGAPDIFTGASLLALDRGQLTEAAMLKEVKRLMRLVLAHYLGNKPIKSRELFMATVL